MRYWSDNRKSCEHVEPREDWKESIEKWIDWMDAIGRTNDTLRTHGTRSFDSPKPSIKASPM